MKTLKSICTIAIILFVFILFCRAPALAQVKSCSCGTLSFDESPPCCKQLIVWSGDVSGVPCLGPLCYDGEQYCNCDWMPWHDDCKVMCAKRAIAIGKQVGTSVRTTFDLCFGSPLPEPYIDEETHERLINSGTVDLENLGQDNMYCHWIASGHTLILFNQLRQDAEFELEECTEPEPEPVGPDCATTSDFRDGAGGALWKPVSENDGKPVILMPPSYCQFAEIEIFSGADLIERPRLANCSANGPRGHWRLARRCGEYSDLTVRFGSECRAVPDSCERFD